MIKKYWISKWTQEWGIVEEESGRQGVAPRPAGWNSEFPKSLDLLNRLEDFGFVLLDRMEFLLLSKALDEQGEPLSFSPLPPEGPMGVAVPAPRTRRPIAPFRSEAMPVAA